MSGAVSPLSHTPSLSVSGGGGLEQHTCKEERGAGRATGAAAGAGGGGGPGVHGVCDHHVEPSTPPYSFDRVPLSFLKV